MTINNDMLYGDLVAITPKQVVIKDSGNATVRFDRSQVAGLQRCDRDVAGMQRMGALSDWSILHRGRRVSEWSREGGTQLVTKVTGAELFRDLHMRTVSEIEISLRWEGKPGFVISFADPDAVRLSRDVVKLETWDNDVVLQTLGANGDFEVIHNIPANEQTLDLRLVWDPATAHLKVYSQTGQLWGEMRGMPESGDQLSGFYLQNKGLLLALTRLRIRMG